MPFVFKCLALILSIAALAASAVGQDAASYKPGPASSYASHQTSAQITIGAEAYQGGEKMKSAFGKLDPNQYGILPVLVVIQNDSDKVIKLDRLKVEYSGPNHDRVDATPARDVRYLKPPQRPSTVPGPAGQIGIIRGKKNPLDAWEIEGRAFSAQILPPGQSASGFFYFQTTLQRNATIVINGLREAATGKEIFYFELPL